MLRLHGTLLTLLSCLACLASLSAGAQVVRTSKGSVEFLGLEKWTPALIQQRLGYTSPDQLHYCAADLKKLGFPEAAVIVYSENGHRVTIVTVVEPQHASEVVYKPRPSQHVPLPAAWRDLEKIVNEPGFLEGGVLDYSRTLHGALTKRPWLSDGTPQTWWPAVQSLNKPSDFRLAQQTLEGSDDSNARALAAVILMNFASEDRAWRSLVSRLRDPDEKVQAVCLQALNSLATFHPRKVDWAPAVPDLVDLLHGTDLFAFQFLLKELTATKVDPALAAPLLGNGGGRLVLAYLRAQHDDQRELAHTFLVAIAGRDLGNDSATWEAWLAHLG